MIDRLERGLLLAVLIASAWFPARAAEARPPLLEAEEGCELWLGTASGNDPSVRVNLRLCGEAEVTGQFQWSSTESGWNLRSVAGQWSGDTLIARDTGILQEAPRPGWRFCEVDRYELRRTGDQLVGTYRSEACSDRAEMRLTRVAGGDSSSTNPPAPPPNPDPPGVADPLEPSTPEPRVADPPPPAETNPTPRPVSLPSAGGCGCSARGSLGGGISSMLLLLVVIGLRTRRHSHPAEATRSEHPRAKRQRER
ncbi:MAG: hypothetical protein AAGF12_26160 [Myxococcota bacterium]